MTFISLFIRVHAAMLLACGILLLFSPDALLDDSSAPALLLVQLLGASFLGFAAASWTVRDAVLGGIYGRAVVIGLQTFLFVATMVLLRGISEPMSRVLWFVSGVVAVGAIFYSILAFRPSLLQRRDTN